MPDATKIAEYQSAVTACALARQLLAQHDLPGLLSAIDHAHTTGPLLDPTLYLAKVEAMEEDRRLLEAALQFVRAEVRRG